MKKRPKFDLNSINFELSKGQQLFLNHYHQLLDFYEELFYEELKESAEKV